MESPPTQAKCPKCGNLLAGGANSCSVCGWNLGPIGQGPARSGSNTIQILLLIFLGGPALLVGGCYFMWGIGGAGPDSGEMLLLGVLGILIFGALLVWTLKSGRRP